MTSNILQQGNKFTPVNEKDIKLTEDLPVATYSVKHNSMTGEFFLTVTNDFTIPEKMYGDIADKSDRIMSTFLSRKQSTGIHLTGIKGSGKTLLAKMLSVKGKELGFPTLLINEGFGGDGFRELIQHIPNPCIVIFDEFEKNYDHENQNELLTLLDGIHSSEKLIILTSNDGGRYNSVTTYLKNRPGRIYYEYTFDNLSKNFIEEYCKDTLEDQTKIEGVLTGSSVFQGFNFDMLQAAVEEMNRYNESFFDVVEHLNICFNTDNFSTYSITLKFDGYDDKVLNNEFSGFNPAEFNYYCDLYQVFGYEDCEELDILRNLMGCVEFQFESKHFVEYDSETQTFRYQYGPAVLEVKEIEPSRFSYRSVF